MTDHNPSPTVGHFLEVVVMFSGRSKGLFPILAVLAVALFSQGGANAASVTTYAQGGSTIVVRADGQAIVDNGGVICNSTGPSVGGGCVDFASLEPGTNGGGVGVDDAENGENVAFQVCIDNNGDGICGGPQGNSKLACGDDQFFSHSDDGRFFNPLGPLPGSFRRGCPGSEWNGYVVFLCTGVHEVPDSAGAPSAPHAHSASNGVIRTTHDAEGYGNFCGGDGIQGATGDLIAKAYAIA